MRYLPYFVLLVPISRRRRPAVTSSIRSLSHLKYVSIMHFLYSSSHLHQSNKHVSQNIDYFSIYKIHFLAQHIFVLLNYLLPHYGQEQKYQGWELTGCSCRAITERPADVSSCIRLTRYDSFKVSSQLTCYQHQKPLVAAQVDRI